MKRESTKSPTLILLPYSYKHLHLYIFIHRVKDFFKIICPAVSLPAAEVVDVSFVSIQSGKVNSVDLACFVHARKSFFWLSLYLDNLVKLIQIISNRQSINFRAVLYSVQSISVHLYILALLWGVQII